MEKLHGHNCKVKTLRKVVVRPSLLGGLNYINISPIKKTNKNQTRDVDTPFAGKVTEETVENVLVEVEDEVKRTISYFVQQTGFYLPR